MKVFGLLEEETPCAPEMLVEWKLPAVSLCIGVSLCKMRMTAMGAEGKTR